MSTLTLVLDGNIEAQESVDGDEPSDDFLDEIRDALVLALERHHDGRAFVLLDIRVTI